MMRFTAFVSRVGDRLLSTRTFDLVVAPALADYEFDRDNPRVREWESRLAVLIALSGALRMEVARELFSFALLAVVPACYYIALMTICADFFKATGSFWQVSAIIMFLSLGPVMVCFWPDRRVARSTE